MGSRAKAVLPSRWPVGWLPVWSARSWALMRQGKALRSLAENSACSLV